jgi:hypothetical protein
VAGYSTGVAVLVKQDGWFATHVSSLPQGANPLPTTAIDHLGNEYRVVARREDSLTEIAVINLGDWMQEFEPVKLRAEELEPGAPVMAFTYREQEIGQFLSNENPGLMSPSLRYIPLSKMEFETSLDHIGGALLFDERSRLIGFLGATFRPVVRGQAMENVTQAEELAAQNLGPLGVTVAFSLDASVVNRVVSDLLSPDGEVQHPSIGVFFKNNGGGDGVVLEEVMPDSPAAKAGLQVGDIIVQAAERPVANAIDFATILFRQDPGDVLKIEFLRNETRETVDVAVVAR